MNYRGSCHCGKIAFEVPQCGIHRFAEGTDPKGNPMAAVNVRCLEGIDLDKVPVTRYDGRSK
jgi:hypothetical protein